MPALPSLCCLQYEGWCALPSTSSNAWPSGGPQMLYEWLNSYPIHFTNPDRIEMIWSSISSWMGVPSFSFTTSLFSQAPTCVYCVYNYWIVSPGRANRCPFLQGMQLWYIAWAFESWMGFSPHAFPSGLFWATHTVCGTHSLFLCSPVALIHEETTNHLPDHIVSHATLKSFTCVL